MTATISQPVQTVQTVQPVQVVQPPGQQYAPPPAYAYTPPPPATGTAVAGFVLAFFVPVVGLILGYVAKNEIRNSGGTKGGDGLATAAIALGWVFTALGIVWLIVYISASSMYYYY